MAGAELDDDAIEQDEFAVPSGAELTLQLAVDHAAQRDDPDAAAPIGPGVHHLTLVSHLRWAVEGADAKRSLILHSDEITVELREG